MAVVSVSVLGLNLLKLFVGVRRVRLDEEQRPVMEALLVYDAPVFGRPVLGEMESKIESYYFLKADICKRSH